MKNEKMTGRNRPASGNEKKHVSTEFLMNYARENFTPAEFRSLRRAKIWQVISQIAMPVAIIIGALIYRSLHDMTWGEILPPAIMILVTGSVVWAVVAESLVGLRWTRFTTWYKDGCKQELLPKLFGRE